MKYIDAEKLIAEIAKLRKEHTTREYRDEAALVLDDLEDYIDSLQQEQPSLPSNLDEAAEEFEKHAMEDYDEICVNEDGSESPVLNYDLKDAFKAGAEWMARQGSSFKVNVEEVPQGHWYAGLHLGGCAEEEK